MRGNRSPGFDPVTSWQEGNVRGSSRKCAAITALAFAGVIAAGCSKKNDYGADTSAAMTADTTSATYSASSTVPATQDTTTTSSTKSTGTKSTGTKSTGTKSTTSKTTKKTTY
jgi:hypothetical protein